jgi:hypothetical protein
MRPVRADRDVHLQHDLVDVPARALEEAGPVVGVLQPEPGKLGRAVFNGNVWEVVPSGDSRGYQVRGGAFNCGAPSQRFQCDYNAGWNDLYAGFRCCQDR